MEIAILNMMSMLKSEDARALIEQLHDDYEHDRKLLRSCTTTHYPEGTSLLDLAAMHGIATCKCRYEKEKSE